ncbi:MAG: hypothetical protein B7733_22065 [Myxococcales bacterium FL481]|nr:MAG: hypothetical protein B7733_22065 [Myxococcales bacterium FL481]
MLRIHRTLAHLAVALGLGGVALAHPVVLPALEAASGLIDANLAKALAVAVHQRIDDGLLVVSALAAASMGRASGTRLGTTLGLLALICVAAERFWLLPQLSQTWSQLDLTVGRPLHLVDVAQTLERVSLGISAAVATLFGAMAWLLASGGDRLGHAASRACGAADHG